MLFAATDPAAENGGYYGPKGFLEFQRPTAPARVPARARDTAAAAAVGRRRGAHGSGPPRHRHPLTTDRSPAFAASRQESVRECTLAPRAVRPLTTFAHRFLPTRGYDMGSPTRGERSGLCELRGREPVQLHLLALGHHRAQLRVQGQEPARVRRGLGELRSCSVASRGRQRLHPPLQPLRLLAGGALVRRRGARDGRGRRGPDGRGRDASPAAARRARYSSIPPGRCVIRPSPNSATTVSHTRSTR